MIPISLSVLWASLEILSHLCRHQMPLDKSTFSKLHTKTQGEWRQLNVLTCHTPRNIIHSVCPSLSDLYIVSHHYHTYPFSFIYHSPISLFVFSLVFFLFYLSCRIQMQVKWLYGMLDSGSREISHARWQLMRHHSQHVPLVYQCKLSVCISIYLYMYLSIYVVHKTTYFSHSILCIHISCCFWFGAVVVWVFRWVWETCWTVYFPLFCRYWFFPQHYNWKYFFLHTTTTR